MSLQSDNCNDITNSLLCTPIIWNHSEKNWNGISLRVVSEGSARKIAYFGSWPSTAR